MKVSRASLRVKFLGTPEFVEPVKQALAKNYTLTDNLNEADLLVVAAYGQILPSEMINKPKYGTLNIHPSLLPKYRGASPIQAAILNGDTETGVTIMKIDEKMDHGPILLQEKYPIKPTDTFDSLSKKLFQIGADMLIRVIPDYISGKLKSKEQNHEQASFCKMIKKEDGYFEIDNPPHSRGTK